MREERNGGGGERDGNSARLRQSRTLRKEVSLTNLRCGTEMNVLQYIIIYSILDFFDFLTQ